MVRHADFSHGTAFMDRITAAGFHWSNVGENIATGYETPSAVVAAWMASQGHCANILNPVYREVGTGVALAPVRGAANIDGTWTQDFGLVMGQHPASADFRPGRGLPVPVSRGPSHPRGDGPEYVNIGVHPRDR